MSTPPDTSDIDAQRTIDRPTAAMCELLGQQMYPYVDGRLLMATSSATREARNSPPARMSPSPLTTGRTCAGCAPWQR